MDESESLNIAPRRLTSLERGQIAMNYAEIKERPDRFILDNRYLERQGGEAINDLNLTPLENKRSQVKSLVDKLRGGNIASIHKLHKTPTAVMLDMCDEHSKVDCEECKLLATVKTSELVLPKIPETTTKQSRNQSTLTELKLDKL